MTYLPATSSDFTTDGTTNQQSVTGVTVPAPASRVIEFEFRGVLDPNATTTGCGFSIDVPSGSTILATSRISVTTTAGTDVFYETIITSDDQAVTFPTDISDNARFEVKGRVVTSTTEGSIQLRIDQDVASAQTVKKGVTRWYQDCCAA